MNKIQRFYNIPKHLFSFQTMTLFHLRELWSTQCGIEEEFDRSSICLGNIDNSIDGFDKIIVGSFNGILRVYKIDLNSDDLAKPNHFEISDLLLEADLRLPILQIQSGCLMSSDNVQLAVLHPEKVCVYSISCNKVSNVSSQLLRSIFVFCFCLAVSGVADHGNSSNILLIYELKLQTKAYNMLVGPMGTPKGKDIICVQSIDSNFDFFENESYLFSYRNINCDLCEMRDDKKDFQQNFPVEIAFIPKRDLLILITDSYVIDCYQYQEIALNADQQQKKFQLPDQVPKKSLAEWSYHFGEFVLDIQVVNLIDKWCLIALGERHLCVLHENGQLYFSKKLDLNPTSVFAFANDKQDSLIVIIGTQSNNLLIYQNEILRWATKIPFVPIAIRRGNFNEITGTIVLLSTQGQLAVSYLGTNPSLKLISIPSNGESNNSIEQMELELRELKNRINFDCNNTNSGSDQEQENLFNDQIQLSVDDWQRNSSDSMLTCALDLTPMRKVNNLKLIFHENDFYTIEPKERLFEALSESIQVKIRIINKDNPPIQNVIKMAIMFTRNNTVRIVNKQLRIPFDYLIKPMVNSNVQFQSSSSSTSSLSGSSSNMMIISKLILSRSNSSDEQFPTRMRCKSLLENLTEYFSPNIEDGLGFTFANFEQIFASIKSINRGDNVCFIVESNNAAGWLLSMQELLRQLFKKIPNNCFRLISFQINQNIIENILAATKSRVDCKMNIIKIKKEIEKFTEHFRVLQKQILVRSKEKTPVPLNNLQKVLFMIQQKIVKKMDILMILNSSIDECNHRLWIQLMILKLILKKFSKCKSEKLEQFVSLIAIKQMAHFDSNWEQLFQLGIHEIFDLNKELKNVSKSINFNVDDIEYLGQILRKIFTTMSENLITIDFDD
ncbi:PTHB1-like protein [Sarcoptes scabiei]|uniref:PTHB1-like protein n=1 Tax=Sarcoptes scabiei TaxID=52283 RepID=A0A132AED3_SARSC|nr:PTHB1-like protein [Sarcoptes scabiei]